MARSGKRLCTDIQKAANQIQNVYAPGINFAQFQSNQALQDAITYQISILGEAAAQLLASYSAGIAQAEASGYTGLTKALRNARSTRNFVLHQFWNVTPKLIWNTLQPSTLQHYAAVAGTLVPFV
ncbi:HepT-like ribonuclease domain-containing protein [Paraburkholderia bannensis]|uniref:HepT-like ribonuclease domain-containing protein n=1 Tax=Paraburkholderia bannensis TaxID=765414 RepID=UPI0038CD6307